MVRLKTRYVLFDIIYPPTDALPSHSRQQSLIQLHQTSNGFNLRTIAELTKRQIQNLFGDQGTGLASLSLVVKYFSQKTSTGIIRCPRDHYRYVVAALTSMRKIGDKQVIIRVLKVSGTIKKSEDYAIERNRKLLRSMNLKEEDMEDGIRDISEDEEDDD